MALPAGWEETTLGDILNRLQYGYTASASADIRGARFLRITDLQECGVDWKTVPGCDISAEDLDKYRLRDGDFVFARSGSIEKAWRVKDAPLAVFASYLIRGTPLDPALGSWLEAFVRSRSYLAQIGAAGAGIGMQNVNASKLAAVRLPLAPISEQQRIVAKLDAIFEQTRAAKSRLKRLPALLEKLKRSILAAAFRGDLTKDWRAAHAVVEPASVLLDRIREEVRRNAPRGQPHHQEHPVTDSLPAGWCWANLGDLGTFLNGDRGKNYPSGDAFVESGVPFINAGHLVDGIIEESSLNFITEAHFARLGGGKVQSGDVLYCLRGSLGKAAIVRPGERGAIASSLLLIRPGLSLLSEFIYYYLISPLGERAIQEHDNGSAQPNLAAASVKQYVVPLPPREEIGPIVEVLRSAFQRLATLRKRANDLNDRCGALERATLAKAFQGELVPQNPNDEPASVLLERIRASRATQPESPRRGRRLRREAPTPEHSAESKTNGRTPTAQQDESLDLVIAMFQQGKPRLTAIDITKATGLQSNAVKKALSQLVAGGQVRVHGRARGTTYEWTV